MPCSCLDMGPLAFYTTAHMTSIQPIAEGLIGALKLSLLPQQVLLLGNNTENKPSDRCYQGNH